MHEFPIAEVNADVRLIEPHDIVQIAADVTRRAKEHVEVRVANLRQGLGQKVPLQSSGKAKLFEPIDRAMRGYHSAHSTW